MKKSFTAVIDRNITISETGYLTEPYEAGWAGEARWFVRVIGITGTNVSLRLYPQISPDGLFWCDEGSPPLLIHEEGVYSFVLSQFGNWLRLRGELSGENPQVKTIIYLALKE